MSLFWQKKKWKEKRRHDRFEFRFEVKVITETSVNIFEVDCRNLSEGGLLFICKTPFLTYQECRVEMELPVEDGKLVLRGIVVRSDYNRDEGVYNTGIAFQDVSEENVHLMQKVKALYS